jgi:Coenzyme PQQ synthesis protein D (PqqD)
MSEGQRPSRAEGLEVNTVADGLVIYQSAPEQVHYLNNTSAIVFELSDGTLTVAEIAEQMQSLFSLPEAPVGEVETCVTDLVAKAVLQ